MVSDFYLQKRLEDAIDDFLATTALWSVQWFNKPKFHLLVHLLRHIRRFGPAILMATEGFESFNFVIQLRSILSNRHAPSVDIAAAMSFMHAVCHLVSGGFMESQGVDSLDVNRRQSGPEVQRLLDDMIFLKFMGMTNLRSKNLMGHVTFLQGQPSIPWRHTQVVAKGYNIPQAQLDDIVDYCASVKLANGDTARLMGFVLVQAPQERQDAAAKILLGCIEEIIQQENGPVIVLLTEWDILDRVLPYCMPSVHVTRHCIAVAVQVRIIIQIGRAILT